MRVVQPAPGTLLVVLPDDPAFTVVAATDARLVGRAVSDAFPALPTALRRAAETREPVRSEASQRSLLSTPVVGPDARLVYLIVSAEDTARVQHRDAFLANLDDATRPLIDPVEILTTATRLLAEHLEVDSLAYSRFEPDEETFHIMGDFNRPGMPSLLGRYTLSDFDPAVAASLRANKPYVVDDVQSGPDILNLHERYRRVRIGANATVPLFKAGRLAAAMSVHQRTPREWRSEDIELVRLVANRCWESIERARVTSELQASERRLRMAQRVGRIGTFEWMMKEQGIVWTPELEALYGIPEGSFRGGFDDWRERVLPEDADRVIAGITDCVARRREEHAYEFRALLPDGKQRWLRAQAQFFYDESGEAVRMLGVNIDIDDQKQAEANLLRQWHTFDTALSHTPDFTYIFDLEGRFTYVNRALLTLWGKSHEEAAGKNFYELEYPTELADRLQSQIEKVIQTKQPVRDHTPFTAPNGATGHYEYIFVPVFGADGRVEAVAGSTRDVTERVRIEQALAASEEKLLRVFAQAPVAIVVFRGRDFVVEMANPSYRALLQGRELVGRRFRDVVPELPQDVWDVFHLVMDTGEPYVANEWNVPYDLDGDGVPEDHWFNAVYNPLREIDGTVSGFVAVLTDVSAQVLARRELERVNRELEEFAYVASHDLQEPLRMVNIYTQLIVKRLGGTDANLLEYASFVSQGVTRMETLIRDLLSFSKTVQKDESPPGVADLSASLAEAVTVLDSRIKENRAVVRAGTLPAVRGDTLQLAQVFQNLLSNALKYRKKDAAPEILIEARPEGEQWIVSVRDNGIGFDMQYADRIFGLFKRLHKNEYPGTGLGLAICKRVVERYGGRIWAEGQIGEGAVFYFSLPRA